MMTINTCTPWIYGMHPVSGEAQAWAGIARQYLNSYRQKEPPWAQTALATVLNPQEINSDSELDKLSSFWRRSGKMGGS